MGNSSTSSSEREEFQMGPKVRWVDPADSVTQSFKQPGDDDISLALVPLWNLGCG